MVQTLYSWAWKDDYIDKPKPNLILVDEGHSHQAKQSQDIILHGIENGATVLYFTATPVGMAGNCDALIEAGTYSQLQRDKILVPVDVYAPTEVDMKGLKKVKGEFSQKAMARRVQESGVLGDIYEHWTRLNPWAFPTAVFAPSVASSKWIAESVFGVHGIMAKHIDGESTEDERADCFADLAEGKIQVVSSCGVLREGWNCPAVRHAILLQVCGKLSTYLQIAGRPMRAHPGKEVMILQDHTGAWHRHGPPDIDRNWLLNQDDSQAATKRQVDLDEKRIFEGICCPKCSHVRYSEAVCPNCKHKHKRSVRMLRQVTGELVKVQGPVHKPKKVITDTDRWTSELFRGSNANLTVGQCRYLFKEKHGYYPSDAIAPTGDDRKKKVDVVYPWIGKVVNRRRRV